ncbi:uncharacterized protein LOC142785147 [Rhipicephalus microplus]|uniref:uncharacterized protein LOC142785147 n=1 Tax=Rhipicephalus microplus TaxID=6941 RepID=UPI003F6BC91E
MSLKCSFRAQSRGEAADAVTTTRRQRKTVDNATMQRGQDLGQRCKTQKAGKCPHCAEKSSDIFNMGCECQSTPRLTPKPNTIRKNWEVALLGCSNLASQKALVNRARVALDANGFLQLGAHLLLVRGGPHRATSYTLSVYK